MNTAILKLPSVVTRTGLSRSSIYKKISEGAFPAPISLGSRSVGWVESEIEDYLLKQIAISRQESDVIFD